MTGLRHVGFRRDAPPVASGAFCLGPFFDIPRPAPRLRRREETQPAWIFPAWSPKPRASSLFFIQANSSQFKPIQGDSRSFKVKNFSGMASFPNLGPWTWDFGHPPPSTPLNTTQVIVNVCVKCKTPGNPSSFVHPLPWPRVRGTLRTAPIPLVAQPSSANATRI